MASSANEGAYLWKPQHTDEQDERPNELYRDRDLPRRVVRAVLRRVVDDRREQQADRDRKLVAGYDRAADPLGRALGLVHRDERGDEADAEARKEAADDECGESGRASLEGDSEAKNDAGEHDADSTAEDVGGRGAAQSTCRVTFALSALIVDEMNRAHLERFPPRG